MKKIIYLLALMATSISFSQESEPKIDFKRNELKGNALLLVLGSFDVSYDGYIACASQNNKTIMIFDTYNNKQSKIIILQGYPEVVKFSENLVIFNIIKNIKFEK